MGEVNDTGSSGTEYHVSVLLAEVVEHLNIRPDGIYVDCTFGGGGHAQAILHKLNEAGRLIAFDQDADAKINLPNDDRVLFIPQNFRYLRRFLKLHNIEKVHGVLADLGVSSHQFDKAERGFSTRFDAALDMRMDQRGDTRASEIINTYTQERLHKLFEQYGEVTNAKTLAKTIVEKRKTTKLTTIEDFKQAVAPVVKGNPNKYFAQVFQALRIEVNDEITALKEMLTQLPEVLISGGRAAIISFHSLEDRLVKIFFKTGTLEETEENPFETKRDKNFFKLVNKKPIVAGEEERKKNPRSRSARLRVAERV